MRSIRATICQYEMDTDKKINEFTGTFNVIFRKIPNFKKYYYRFKIFDYTSRENITDIYFGVRVSDIGSLKISKADYLNKRLNYCIQKWVEENDKPLNANFIFHNLAYWYFLYENDVTNRRLLDHDDFKRKLYAFLENNPYFIKINDLNKLKKISGIYLLVLDEYNDYYIGQSKDIKKRIQRHWSRKDYLSGTGIDLYKAKDTTCIYALPDFENLDVLEKKYIKELKKYSMNRLPGGKEFTFEELFEHFNQDKKRITIKDIYNMIEENPNIFLVK